MPSRHHLKNTQINVEVTPPHGILQHHREYGGPPGIASTPKSEDLSANL